MRDTASPPSASPPSTQRRRHPSRGRLDAVTLAALRESLSPPAESDAESERLTAAIMARIRSADATAEAAA